MLWKHVVTNAWKHPQEHSKETPENQSPDVWCIEIMFQPEVSSHVVHSHNTRLRRRQKHWATSLRGLEKKEEKQEVCVYVCTWLSVKGSDCGLLGEVNERRRRRKNLGKEERMVWGGEAGDKEGARGEWRQSNWIFYKHCVLVKYVCTCETFPQKCKRSMSYCMMRKHRSLPVFLSLIHLYAHTHKNTDTHFSILLSGPADRIDQFHQPPFKLNPTGSFHSR